MKARQALIKRLLLLTLAAALAGCGGYPEPEPTLLGSSGLNDDHDYRHITFVNQTGRDLVFEVDIPWGENLRKSIASHESNYISIDSCNSDGYEIKIEEDTFGVNPTLGLTPHRKCGENLYIWHDASGYHVNDEPHIAADLSGCDDDEDKPAILFAHGYNDSQKAWGHFAAIAHDNDWRVFRTSVSQDGSIKKRARMLSAYIVKAADQCKIKEGQLTVVGHSMGGLDLRYIVSYELAAARMVKKVFTIATPHGGSGLAWVTTILHTSDAGHDLNVSHMRAFNEANPYRDFKVGANRVPLLALRFACAEQPNEDDDDTRVEVKNQAYPRAPYSEAIYHGKHCTNSGCSCVHGYKAELELDWLLPVILADNFAEKSD